MTVTKPVIRWGILGCGWISNKFATSIIVDPQSEDENTPKHVIAAVGSSSVEKGKEFVDKIYKDSVEDYTGAYYATYEVCLTLLLHGIAPSLVQPSMFECCGRGRQKSEATF